MTGHPDTHPEESDLFSPNVALVAEDSDEDKHVYVVYLHVYIDEQSFTITKFVEAEDIEEARELARIILTVNNYNDWVINTYCKWELYDVIRLEDIDTVDMDYYRTQYQGILEKNGVTPEDINNTY